MQLELLKAVLRNLSLHILTLGLQYTHPDRRAKCVSTRLAQQVNVAYSNCFAKVCYIQ
jgi:hypothetical protein